MRAAILVQSPKVETYINALAAMQLKYNNIEQFDFIYVFHNSKKILMEEIREKLFVYSKDNDIYKSAIDISCTFINNDYLIDYNKELKKYLLESYSIIDVSGISKNISISVASTMITKPDVHVGMLNWNSTFQKEEQWVLNQENHVYQDLFDDKVLQDLRKDYFRKKNIVFTVIVTSALALIIFCIEIFFPNSFISDKVTTLFGLLIGFVGMMLAFFKH
jgi:hypothetical protein